MSGSFRPKVNFSASCIGPLRPDISKEHDHEFGLGYDLYYRDYLGKIKAEMHGLKPEEAAVLKKKYGL